MPPRPADPKRRKALIAAGVIVAVIVAVLIVRARQQAAASANAVDQAAGQLQAGGNLSGPLGSFATNSPAASAPGAGYGGGIPNPAIGSSYTNPQTLSLVAPQPGVAIGNQPYGVSLGGAGIVASGGTLTNSTGNPHPLYF